MSVAGVNVDIEHAPSKTIIARGQNERANEPAHPQCGPPFGAGWGYPVLWPWTGFLHGPRGICAGAQAAPDCVSADLGAGVHLQNSMQLRDRERAEDKPTVKREDAGY